MDLDRHTAIKADQEEVGATATALLGPGPARPRFSLGDQGLEMTATAVLLT